MGLWKNPDDLSCCISGSNKQHPSKSIVECRVHFENSSAVLVLKMFHGRWISFIDPDTFVRRQAERWWIGIHAPSRILQKPSHSDGILASHHHIWPFCTVWMVRFSEVSGVPPPNNVTNSICFSHKLVLVHIFTLLTLVCSAEERQELQTQIYVFEGKSA